MTIVGHGIDLIECARIEHILQQHQDRFLSRVLTERERAYCKRMKNPIPHIAGRFAAKEAILKVLGTGWRGPIAWTDMEILNDESGQPHVALSGATALVAHQRGVKRMLVSITHIASHAAATAIGLAD